MLRYTFSEYEAKELEEVNLESPPHTPQDDGESTPSPRSNRLKKRARNKIKLRVMVIFTLIIFVGEIVVGYISNSLALIADAFHMLSDMISLIIALVVLWVSSRQKSENFSYGWGRIELLGGFVNGILMFALCFNIIIDAIERLFDPPEIEKPVLLLIMASIGLLLNLIGLLIFRENHGHSHSGKTESNALMQSVFLHVLGDALGSVVVIGSSLFIWLTKFSWRFYIDPIVSFLIAVILLRSSYKLVKMTGSIILQRVPRDVNTKNVKEEILKIVGVSSIHDFHIWQLDDLRNVATLHVLVDYSKDFNTIAQRIQGLMHEQGVHNTTIQPEFVESLPDQVSCLLECVEDECKTKKCCDD